MSKEELLKIVDKYGDYNEPAVYTVKEFHYAVVAAYNKAIEDAKARIELQTSNRYDLLDKLKIKD